MRTVKILTNTTKNRVKLMECLAKITFQSKQNSDQYSNADMSDINLVQFCEILHSSRQSAPMIILKETCFISYCVVDHLVFYTIHPCT